MVVGGVDVQWRVVPVAFGLCIFYNDTAHKLRLPSALVQVVQIVYQRIVLFGCVYIAAGGLGVEQADGRHALVVGLGADDEVDVEGMHLAFLVGIRHGKVLFTVVAVLVPPHHIVVAVEQAGETVLGVRGVGVFKEGF